MQLEFDETSGKILLDAEVFAEMQLENIYLKDRARKLEAALESIQGIAGKVMK